ncbi:hypothetical protein [Thalassovita sp.]|uniref:hypothetical protein n=1 Tax=Thalassovita sp. TaxID=1979401 RepID=UPI0029DE7DCF|nr:hypothetical protein [Thalassovita sp.]
MLRLVLVLLLGWATGGIAEERSALWPDVPAATGAPHPEGNAYWRKNHMTLMKHDRDMSLRDGDRDIGASLKGCFDCHAAKDAAGTVLTYADEGHFCRACHDFAAVKVDCFMCHRSTPEGVDETRAHAALLPPRQVKPDDPAVIMAYLQQAARKEAGQ